MIMIIISIYLTSIYINQTKGKNKELEELNAELKTANQMITVSFDHIKALYQSLSIFSNQGNVEGIINKLFAYIKDVTKTDAVFFYDMKDEEYELLSKGIEKDKKLIEDEIINNLKEILESKNPGEISVQNVRYVIVPVGNNYLYYGVLGFEVTNEKEGLVYQNNLQQVKFLSELTSITLERINMEEINDRLLISEEQNRIANEIHDSVLQRLFGMSCGVFSLIKRLDNCSTVEITEELSTSGIKELVNIVVTSYLNAVSKMIDISFISSIPLLTKDMFGAILSNVYIESEQYDDNVLIIKNEFIYAGDKIESSLYFIPKPGVLTKLFNKLGF
jgi:nitrate/nitrite-specific signal transduction histidine kinase